MSSRCGLDPTLLWLWCRPAAVALIPPVAWELPYAADVALKSKKKKKKKKKNSKRIEVKYLMVNIYSVLSLERQYSIEVYHQ